MEPTISTLLILIATLIIAFYAYIKYCYSYWKNRNVVFLEPTFPMGNNKSVLPKGISIGIISGEFYKKFKEMGLKYGGVYNGLSPDLVIVDPGLANVVMKTAFSHFMDRGIYMVKGHPITVNIFAQTGEEWKVARTKLTSAFTPAKMKLLFPTVEKCCNEMMKHMSPIKEDEDVFVQDLFARFTTDVIGSVIFGVVCNSFTHPDAEFRRMGRIVFDEHTLADMIRLFFTIYFPKMAKVLNVTNINLTVEDFFTNCVKDTVAFREKNKGDYKDFMQILIEMKNNNQITLDEVIGQTFLFFLAGFETSSNAGCMALFELAQHPKEQERTRKEIKDILAKYNSEVTFDNLNEMKYLNQVFEETLRKWPPLSTLTRVCEKDYHLPGTDFVVEKGVRVLIPILAMHLDADYWPEPDKWDPDRFANEIGQGIPYYPFGEGPRYCLGARFGYMQVKLGLANILNNYEVSLSSKTKLPLELHPDTFVVHTKQNIYLKFKKL